MSDPASDGVLERSIRLPQAVALVAGTVLGAAIFVQPSEVARGVSGPAALMAVWGLAGLLALAGSLLCAELASGFREGGGVYRYLHAAWGPPVAFLWAWAVFWAIHSSILAAVAAVFARYLGAMVPALASAETAVAVTAIALLTAVNLSGVRRAASLATALAAAKYVAIALLVGVGLLVTSPGGALAQGVGPAAPTSGEHSFSAALVAALFAFGGWHMATYPTDEVEAPRRTLPRALGIGFSLVLATYLLLNLVYLRWLPFDALASSRHVAADVAAAVAGDAGRQAVALLVVGSTFGALSGLVLAGPRVLHALAVDGLAPRALARVGRGAHVPHHAILVQGAWSSILVVASTYRTLYHRAIVVEWIFFGLMALAVVRLRRTGRPRRFSAPLYPALPLLFAGSAFLLVLHRLSVAPRESFAGILILVAGLPAYAVVARRRARGGP